MSGIVNKAKEVIHDVTHPKDKHHGTTTTTPGTTSAVPEGTAGPHTSRVANAADPRVDSDLDNRAHHTHSAGLTGTHTGPTTGVTSTHGTHTGVTGSHAAPATGSTNAGPHNSNVLNKLDPRVDSDLDRSRNAGLNQTNHPSGYTTGTGSTSIGLDGTTTGSTNAGPHNSNLLNKADPRVDSDLDRSRNAGMNQTTIPGHTTTHTTHTTTGPTGAGLGGTTTGTTGSTNAGPHSSNLLNKLDPRVDSDLDGSRNAGVNQTTTAGGHPTATTGAGLSNTGSTNAGPHSSNIVNKLDPRVDSDLDASRNAGLNQTTRPTY